MASNNYKRIAKNASLLYFRMLLTMAVSLYTSRIVLQALGVEDYGIYNVVAGFVTMLGFLHSAMSSATQRFLSFEIGKSDQLSLQNTFSMCLNIHLLIALSIFVFGEVIGIWFVRNYLTIPIDRLRAAEWVFHLSLISFMVTVISVPYNALIIAHEKMGVFAWVSILDVLLKLMIVFMLIWFSIDKLILFGVLNSLVSLFIFSIYLAYCYYHYSESRFRLYWDTRLFRVLSSYTGWNLWGNIASVLGGQGVNILLNIFFGPSVNAARGVAFQVSGAVSKFVSNVQVAINPQIVKSYARDELSDMHTLVCYGAKYNFYIILILSVPLLNNIDLILSVWLTVVPNDTSIFVKLVIYGVLINSLSGPLMTAAQATGKIKLYQVVVGGILLLNIPLSYIVLQNGFEAYSVYYVAIFLYLVAFIARLLIISKLINMKISKYIKATIVPVIMVSIACLIANYYIKIDHASSLLAFIQSLMTSCSIVIGSILLLGLSKREYEFIFNTVNKIYKKYES